MTRTYLIKVDRITKKGELDRIAHTVIATDKAEALAHIVKKYNGRMYGNFFPLFEIMSIERLYLD